MANVFQAETVAKGDGGREHGIVHIEHSLAFHGRRYEVGPHQWNMRAFLIERDHVTINALFQNHGASADTNMFFHQRVGRMHGDITDVARVRMLRHFQAMLVIGVEHGSVAGDFDDEDLIGADGGNSLVARDAGIPIEGKMGVGGSMMGLGWAEPVVAVLIGAVLA